MEKRQGQSQKVFLAVIALLAWFALIAQFVLIITNGLVPVPVAILRYFCFFTITTNIVVAICCTASLLAPGSFFARPKTISAVTGYILIVGIVYNLILRFIWEPQGLQMVVDELLHLVVPVLFLIYWLVFVPKDQLKWADAFPWLIYPSAYTAIIFILGAITGYYPYPFIDAGKLGVGQTAINSVGLFFAFLTVSILLIGVGKLMKTK